MLQPCGTLPYSAGVLQAANGCFAALLFNLLYDALLSRSVEWHTMCPIIDLMNHRTGIKASARTACWPAQLAACGWHVICSSG